MELLHFTATDGIELHGWLQRATSENRLLAVDAILFLHGAGSNFYSSTLLRGIAPPLLDAGVDILAINTRGHDLATTLKTPHGGRRGGAAFEIVDECRYDVRGAVELLALRGYERIALLGHSLGALKAVYSQALAPHEAVRFVVAVSPPRLSFAAFNGGPRGVEFREFVARAESHLAAGRPQELLEVTIPLPLLITAAGYIDKYRPSERYNLLNFAAQSPTPTFFTFGAHELASGSAAFLRLDAEIRSLTGTSASPIDVDVVNGADHFYTGCTPRLAQTLLAWPRWRA